MIQMNFFTKQKWTHRHRKRTYGYQRENVGPSLFSPVRLLVILWTAARQAPLSMRFYRQEFWSGLPEIRSFAQKGSFKMHQVTKLC